jgi:hypothetical protein
LSREKAAEVLPHLGRFPGPVLICAKAAGKRVWTIKGIKPLKNGQVLPEPFDPRPILYRVWGMRPPEGELAEGELPPDEPEVIHRNGFDKSR